MQHIYSSLMGWMNVSPWVLTVARRKQPIKRTLTDGDKWKRFANLLRSRHLQYSIGHKYKDCEMSQTLTGLFFIELNNDLTPARSWMRGLECRINLPAVTNKCKETKGSIGEDSAEAWEMTHWPLVCESKTKHFIGCKAWCEIGLLGAQWHSITSIKLLQREYRIAAGVDCLYKLVSPVHAHVGFVLLLFVCVCDSGGSRLYVYPTLQWHRQHHQATLMSSASWPVWLMVIFGRETQK